MDAKSLSVTVQADREREIVLDFNVLCEAENYGEFDWLKNGAMPLSLNQLRALCYVSWRREDPTLTLDAVGSILQDHWPHIMERMTDAWLKNMPSSEDTDEDPTKETAAMPPS